MMTDAPPRLLDLFCGAGGAAVGYARAGFEVVGVDMKPQPSAERPLSFTSDAEKSLPKHEGKNASALLPQPLARSKPEQEAPMDTTLLDLYDRVREWERSVAALREATDALIRISQMGGEAGVEADIAVNRMGTALKGYALVPDNEETRREQREDSFLPLRAVPDAALREFAEQPLGVAELMDDAAFERAVGEGRR